METFNKAHKILMGNCQLTVIEVGEAKRIHIILQKYLKWSDDPENAEKHN